MASASSKGFDFASDDILCSYEDYPNQENPNGSHSDSAIASNSAKEFHKSRMGRTSVFPASTYGPPDDSGNHEAIISAVERSMKKHTDNIMRFLEGLSSRLSQLELYCYNLDKSIGEMRSDLTRDHGESDSKLKFLEKHIQEVHRSVQILRDKQELADTQRELAKLQLAQKESSSSHNSQESLTTGAKKNDSHGQQLAIVPASQPQRPPEPLSQQQPYYLPPAPLPTQVNQTRYPQSQVPPPQRQYQQQWAQQVQPGSRPPSPQVYPQYLPAQPPANPSPSEPVPTNMPMPMAYSSQPVSYSYGGPVRTGEPQPEPPQHIKAGFGGPQGDVYAASGQANTYMMYDNQSSGNQMGQFYNPNQQGGGGIPAQQVIRNHAYTELIDKLVSMGYRGDHVTSVIQRLDESGQTVDFNAVLDRLNGQRGWSG